MTGSMVMHRPVEGPVAAGDGGGRPGSLDRQLLLATSETRSDDVASSNVELGQLHGSATAGVQGAAEDKASTRKSTPGVESLMPFSQLLPSLVEVPALTLLSNPPSTAPSNSDAEASLHAKLANCVLLNDASRGVSASDEEDDIFWLEDESQNGNRSHPFSAAMPDHPNERTAALEMNVADDPELARLGGIPPAERVFMYLQVSTSLLPTAFKMSELVSMSDGIKIYFLCTENTVCGGRCGGVVLVIGTACK